MSNKKRGIEDIGNEPPSKKQKLNRLYTYGLLCYNNTNYQCSECEKVVLQHNLLNINKYGLMCIGCCCSSKYKDDTNIWKCITLQSSKSDVLQQCNLRHRSHVDKLKLDELCTPCAGFVNEIDKYSKAINNCEILKALKHILLSYLVHSTIEYYTEIGCPKYQILLDEWYRYTLHKNTLGRSINMLQQMMKKLNMEAFMDLLYELQPWMNRNDLWKIIEYQLPTMFQSPEILPENNENWKKFEDAIEHSSQCCNACLLQKNTTRSWICHIAVKTMLLMYFCVDLYLGSIFTRCIKYIAAHCTTTCSWYWDISKDSSYIRAFGHHVVKGHVINKMKDNDDNELQFKPPIITKEMFKEIKYDMMKETRHGWRWATTAPNPQNAPQGVWFATTSGTIEYIACSK